jgi:hypothetical protein
MKNKKTFKALWNVFLFVISGGSLIYGFVQQKRIVETRLELKASEIRLDSLQSLLNTRSAELKKALKSNKKNFI